MSDIMQTKKISVVLFWQYVILQIIARMNDTCYSFFTAFPNKTKNSAYWGTGLVGSFVYGSPHFILPQIEINWAKIIGSGGIRTHASEETGALNQRLRPLGHATGHDAHPDAAS